MLKKLLCGIFIFAMAAALGGAAQASGPRIALVIGNAQYADPLATSANDAGLIAETLRGAGFEVAGAANLDQDSLRRAFRDFLARAAQAGPDAVAFVYLAGRGLQFEGENYFAPIDATIAHDADIALQAVRVSDFTRGLAALPLRARIVVLDAARANRFAPDGRLAGGLALVEAEPGSLYAFNAAPGTIAPDEPGPYGAYAQALAEMLRQGGVPIDVVFTQTRLRVNETTRGAMTPWDAANIAPPLVLLEGAPNAPAAAVAQNYAAMQARPIASFPANEAYAAALERDTLDGYQAFLLAYPDDPLAGRVRALLAARREALTWRRTLSANSPSAYWSYMRRYPKGPHFYDARRRLQLLSAAPEPPPQFEVYDFEGLPPPPPIEYVIVERPVIIFDPGLYPPPPPPPIFLLPPQPAAFIELPPPQREGLGFLPIPIPVPVPFGRFNGPPGRVIQQNFGQQGPIGQGGGGFGGGGFGRPGQPGVATPGQGFPGQGAPGQGAPAPNAPGQPVAGQPAPGQPATGQPATGKPVPGQPGAAPGAPHAGHPGNSAPAQGAPQPAGQGQPAPGRPASGAPGAADHALPQGAGLPPAAPTAHPPASAGPGAAPAVSPPAAAPPAPAAGAGAADHALPQGANLPPVPKGMRPGPAPKPGAAAPAATAPVPAGSGATQSGATGQGAIGSGASKPAAPPAARPDVSPAPGGAGNPAPPAARPAPHPQAAPQQTPPRPQAAPQQMAPHPQAAPQQTPPRPQAAPQQIAPRPQAAPQQMQQRPQAAPPQQMAPRPQAAPPQQQMQQRPQPQQMQQRPQPQQMQQRPQPQQTQAPPKPAGKPAPGTPEAPHP